MGRGGGLVFGDLDFVRFRPLRYLSVVAFVRGARVWVQGLGFGFESLGSGDSARDSLGLRKIIEV